MDNQFVSPSTAEECTASQLIAELMCVRKYQKKGINLPYKFWNIEQYRKEYKTQIIAANSILKVYSPYAILNALKRKEGNWCYSLRIAVLQELFEEEQKKLDEKSKLIEKSQEIQTSTPDEFRQVGGGIKSKKARLD